MNRGSPKIALAVTISGSFLTPFMGSAVTVALPSIGREFAMDAVLLSWIPSAYLLSTAVFLVPLARVGDIYGRKKLFSFGISTYVLASALSAASPSALFLILVRIFQGLSASMIFGTAVAILTSIFPQEERGKVIGFNVGSVYLGLSLGPFIGGLLTEHWGWRSIFVLDAFLGILILGAVLTGLKGEWVGARGERFDLPGSLLYCLTLVSLMYGVSRLPHVTGAGCILLGILGLLAFIQWERRVKNPILDVTLFWNNRVFTFSSLAALISYCATFGVGFLLSLFLQITKGYSPWQTGSILVAQPVMQAIFSPFAGRLSDRVEPQIVASAGMGFTFAGLLILTFLHQASTLGHILIALICLGLGFGLFSSPNTNAIMSSVDKKMYGVASGVVATMRLIGQMSSMAIIALIFIFFLGRVQITPEFLFPFLKSSRTAFAIFAGLCFLGIFASLARGKIHPAKNLSMPTKHSLSNDPSP